MESSRPIPPLDEVIEALRKRASQSSESSSDTPYLSAVFREDLCNEYSSRKQWFNRD